MAQGGEHVDVSYSAMKDTKLWVKINATGMQRLSELDMAKTIFSTAQEVLGTETFAPENILGVQYMNAYKAWIVYPKNIAAKAMILSLNSIPVNNVTYPVCDFSRVGMRTKSLRVSIHGIPQHVDDAEIEDEHMIRDSSVQKAKVKGAENSPFPYLYSGNRFCYVTRVFKDIPRFTNFTMADPEDSKKLVTTKVVIYYDGQPINCRICQDLAHQVEDCPKNTYGTGPNCYKCGQLGHIKKDCPLTAAAADKPESATNNAETTEHQAPEQKTPVQNMQQARVPAVAELAETKGGDEQTGPAQLAQAIIDHLLLAKDGDPAASPPELMNRVQHYLDSHNELRLETAKAASTAASTMEDHDKASLTSADSETSTKEEGQNSKKRKVISPLGADKKAPSNKTKTWLAKKFHKNKKNNTPNDTGD